MPPEDQAIRSAARCATHPSTASVAICHSCGRPLCLDCAVPVRGEVYGPECLAEVLGPDATPPKAVPSRPRDVVFEVAGLAFVGMVAGTVLPWTRFGVGSGTFGGWGFSPLRWSSLSTIAAVIGLGLWISVRTIRFRAPGPGTMALLALDLAVAAGSILHLYNPPPFTHPWIGPWVALGSACLGISAIAWLLTRGRIRSGRGSGIP